MASSTGANQHGGGRVGPARDRPSAVRSGTGRSRDGPRRFLRGWNGNLQADAFGGDDRIYAGEAGGKVIEVACWSHARRKFYDARESDPVVSNQALAYIRLLYAVETEARQRANAIRNERANR